MRKAMYNFVAAAVGIVITVRLIYLGIRSAQESELYSEAQRDRVRRLAQRGDIQHERYE